MAVSLQQTKEGFVPYRNDVLQFSKKKKKKKSSSAMIVVLRYAHFSNVSFFFCFF